MEDAIVTDESLELQVMSIVNEPRSSSWKTHTAAKGVTLHPVHHVASIAIASCHCVLHIDTRDVFHEVKAVDQVIEWTPAPIVSYPCIHVSVEKPSIPCHQPAAISSPHPTLPVMLGVTTTYPCSAQTIGFHCRLLAFASFKR